jgi:hypothetical protein
MLTRSVQAVVRVLDELVLAAGVILIAIGCWDLWRPGAFLVPGAILVWISLPARTGFIARPSDSEQKGAR